MASQFWTSPLNAPAPILDGGPLASSTALTTISPTPDCAIKGGTLTAGQVIRVNAFGRYGTTGTPTLLLGLYWGGSAGVQLFSGATALTCASSVTNGTWSLEAMLTVRSIGSTGTIIGVGRIGGVSAASATDHAPATAPAAVTVDTTSVKALVLAAQWGTSNAANTITVHHFSVEGVG